MHIAPANNGAAAALLRAASLLLTDCRRRYAALVLFCHKRTVAARDDVACVAALAMRMLRGSAARCRVGRSRKARAIAVGRNPCTAVLGRKRCVPGCDHAGPTRLGFKTEAAEDVRMPRAGIDGFAMRLRATSASQWANTSASVLGCLNTRICCETRYGDERAWRRAEMRIVPDDAVESGLAERVGAYRFGRRR